MFVELPVVFDLLSLLGWGENGRIRLSGIVKVRGARIVGPLSDLLLDRVGIRGNALDQPDLFAIKDLSLPRLLISNE